MSDDRDAGRVAQGHGPTGLEKWDPLVPSRVAAAHE